MYFSICYLLVKLTIKFDGGDLDVNFFLALNVCDATGERGVKFRNSRLGMLSRVRLVLRDA